ncbi:MAG: flagellar export chaperone FliS [Myxococcota bacterium]|nr:flagellar export chaperone FliS [Myxococcota bacterium]
MANVNYQQQTYRKVQLETANPGRILLMLYDAAIRFVRLAKQQIEAGDMAAKGIALSKAYAIIAEFINALDHDKAPELCQNLEAIYGFMLEKMSEANTLMTAEPLIPVLTHLVDLRATWAEAVAKAAITLTEQTPTTEQVASR